MTVGGLLWRLGSWALPRQTLFAVGEQFLQQLSDLGTALLHGGLSQLCRQPLWHLWAVAAAGDP